MELVSRLQGLKRPRPVLWTGAKRRCEDPTTGPHKLARTSRELSVDEQSTRIPCHYLQAHLFIKRRTYLTSGDPRLLLQAKALEGELRRRMFDAMASLQTSPCL